MNIRSLITVLVIVVSVQTSASGGPTFYLTDSDFLAVTSYYTKGYLEDDSSTDIQPGGSVDQLSAYDNSIVIVSGGSVDEIYADDTSAVNLYDGSVASLYAGGSSTVYISGGAVTDYLGGWDTSELTLTGGEIAYLDAGGCSQTTFFGYGWSATDGLSIVGNEVFGTGWLSGYWADGTAWSTYIGWNDEDATIILAVIPAPGAILLAAMGTSVVVWLHRRRVL